MDADITWHPTRECGTPGWALSECGCGSYRHDPDNPEGEQLLICQPAALHAVSDPDLRPPAAHFDTDSTPVGLDNRCSACMSHIKEDFVGELLPSNMYSKGFGGTQNWYVMKGTIRWHIADDKGHVHELLIPNSYCP